MPKCGSQVILCDVPVRFDTYKGCSHACTYCFAKRNLDIRHVEPASSADALSRFVRGERTMQTSWCDWDIPLHWGGVSDPFQPIERKLGRSLECLKVFAKSKYPFIVSTKNALIAEEPYLSLIKECNCVIQFSAVSPKYNAIERGASTFEERLEAVKKISPFVRVNIRVQPYEVKMFEDVKESIRKFHEAGVHGVIFEAMKYYDKREGTIRLGGDFVYPSAVLQKHFAVFKSLLHSLGMKFYCGENRLRGMSDELCCCGVEGLGWRVNTANLNHFVYDRAGFVYSDSMKVPNTYIPFRCIHQHAISSYTIKGKSYKECMDAEIPKKLNVVLPDNYKR